MMRATLWVALTASIGLMANLVTALEFGIIGDWGMGGQMAGSIAETRSAAAYKEICGMINCNFTLSVGDQIYVGDVNKGLTDSFENTLPQTMPYFPSIGNHDNAGGQIEYTKRNNRWRFPAGFFTEVLPIDNTGYTVQIFSVNSMDGSLAGGGQKAWLENELKKSTSRWKIIFGHFPVTSAGRHRRSGAVGSIPGLMDQYNAQVYFCGHDHILEHNMINGRHFPLSGAMSRGGMMLRGIAGQFHRWTLTAPSEYNKYMQDWPLHGFITASVSPNVMTMSFWDHYGTLMYEVSTTWDWLERVKNVDKDKLNMPTPNDVVREALDAEMKLPKGPGGGVVYYPDGTRVELPEATTLAPGETSAPTTTPPPTEPVPTTDQPPPAPVETMAEGLKQLTEHPHPPHNGSCGVPPAWTFIHFALAADCAECDATQIVAGVPFSVYISGYDVTTQCTQLFLTTSPLGCNFASDVNNAFVLTGTDRATQPSSNVFHFTTPVSLPPSQVYVCLSADHGATFKAVVRADRYVKSFTINARDETSLTPPPSTGEQQQQQQQQGDNQGAAPTPDPHQQQPAAGNTGAQQQQQGGNTGLSVGAVAIIAVACVVAGVGLSQFLKGTNWQSVDNAANGGDE